MHTNPDKYVDCYSWSNDRPSSVPFTYWFRRFTHCLWDFRFRFQYFCEIFSFIYLFSISYLIHNFFFGLVCFLCKTRMRALLFAMRYSSRLPFFTFRNNKWSNRFDEIWITHILQWRTGLILLIRYFDKVEQFWIN